VAQSTPSLLGYVLSFLSAPIIVSGLGLRLFGIWALTGALAQYGALLDLGVGVALARYVALADGDRRRSGQYMFIGWMSVLVIGVVLGLACFPAAGPISSAMHGISREHMLIVLLSSVTMLCCAMLQSIIGAYPIGQRRMTIPNVASGLGAGINFAASVGAILLGASLPGYALANAGAGIVTVALVAAMVVRSEGLLPLAVPSLATIKDFLRYSVQNQIIRLMDLVNYQTDKIVVAFSIGPLAAGAYELANRVAIAVRQVGAYATVAVDIELTAGIARSGVERAAARYRRLTEVTTTFCFPPVLLAMASAPLLFEAWLAKIPPHSEAILVGLCAAYLVAVSTGVGYALAAAAGKPGLVARTSVGSGVANIVLTAALAPFLGIWGILGGTVLALTGGAIAQIWIVHRSFSLPASAYLRVAVPALRAYTLFALPIALLAYAHPIHGRIPAAIVLVGISYLYLLTCVAWAVRSKRLPESVAARLPRFAWARQ
jgi:O-antigen/teichoic acid export membrane protein